MVEAAAHLVDHVFPPLPVRQWVLALPKRLRYFLRHDRRTVTAVLTIFLRVVEQVLRERSPGAAPKARLGAVSFVHRFGSSLNEHVHFHCCVIDGIFEPAQGGEEAVRFREAVLTDADVQAVQARVRQRVLRWFASPILGGLRKNPLPADFCDRERLGTLHPGAHRRVRRAPENRPGAPRRYACRTTQSLLRLQSSHDVHVMSFVAPNPPLTLLRLRTGPSPPWLGRSLLDRSSPTRLGGRNRVTPTGRYDRPARA